jgi:hypothetical protein
MSQIDNDCSCVIMGGKPWSYNEHKQEKTPQIFFKHVGHSAVKIEMQDVIAARLLCPVGPITVETSCIVRIK